MGTRVIINSQPYEVIDFSVSEDVPGVLAGDTSGGTGTFTLSFPTPLDETHPVHVYGSAWLVGRELTLSDSFLGFTSGTITSADHNESVVSLSGSLRLSKLNVFDVKAQPYIGTLGGAFAYYLSLAGVTTGFQVHSSVTSKSVVLRGFSGDLWFYLKQLAVAYECDISLVSGVILLRPIRLRVGDTSMYTQVQSSVSSGGVAQSVEVYWYDSTPITNSLIYPPGGWKPETEVLNVNAGERTEYQLELSSSVVSIVAPTMTTFVSQGESGSSVYTVIADDGFPVSPALWVANGGSVTFSINPDTSSLTATLVGATNIPVITGGYSKSFSLALASGTSGSQYSTLRILGTGVRYERKKHTFPTGVPASVTATEVGETIDNPFITSLNDLYGFGTRAATRYSGATPSLSGSLVSINERGATGDDDMPTYASTQSSLSIPLGGSFTYASLETHYLTTLGLTDYQSVYNYWFGTVEGGFSNQAFGNAGGARIWHPRSRRWYRVRSATLTPSSVDFDADDDLTHADRNTAFVARTYGQLQTSRSSLTYQQERLVGLID